MNERIALIMVRVALCGRLTQGNDSTWRSNGRPFYRHNNFRKHVPAGLPYLHHQKRVCHFFLHSGMVDPGSTNAPQRHQELTGVWWVFMGLLIDLVP
jgi:hypothetical protein